MSARAGSLAGAELLASRLAAIGAELRAWRALWSQHAFREPRLGWEADLPALSQALRALDPAQSERLHADSEAADAWLGRWLPVADWQALERVPDADAATVRRAWPREVARDVPGRKWRQVEAFVAAMQPAGTLLDWCAGKAHLGRALAARFDGTEVLALERDAALAGAAAFLAARAGLALRPVCCDVFSAQAAAFIDRSTHLCALHACGHLHLRLLELALLRRPAAISLAPCCYHLGGEVGTRALSEAGRATWPGFAVADLRTAVQETVTADAHVRRRRRHLQQWQLGFDALLRELRGVDQYLPIPALETRVLRGDFAGFCAVLAERMRIGIPAGVDLAAFEARGVARFAEVAALDLVRQRFRRLIELCIVIDRALHLHEHGYRVALTRFCPRALSPRNLLLEARRAG